MNPTLATPGSPGTEAFLKLVRSGIRFRLFLLAKLPAAFYSGLRIEAADTERCSVSVPFGWRTQNPFRSTYFACLSMGAEMTTGLLAMAHSYGLKPSVSMLVVGMEARYHKKATGTTVFTCKDGELFREAMEEAVRTGEARTVTARSEGYSRNGELMAEFWFTWSFKQKKNT